MGLLLDMGGFPQPGGPILVNRRGRRMRGGLPVAMPVSTQLTSAGAEPGITFGSPPIPGSVQIFRNRVLVHPSSYTISGMTLLLTSGLTFRYLDKIEVYYQTYWLSKIVAALISPFGYSQLVMARSSLVAYYKADETSGTTMFDSSGNGYHGTYTSDAVLNQTPLRIGSTGCIAIGLSSAIANQAAYAAGPFLTAGGNAFTWECIVKVIADSATNYAGIMESYDAGDNPRLAYPNFTGQNNLEYALSTNDLVSPNATRGSITHCAVVVTAAANGGAANTTLYENGVAVGTSNWGHDPASPNGIYFLGHTGGVSKFRGYASDFAIYSSALSGAEILADYNAMVGFAGDRDQPYNAPIQFQSGGVDIGTFGLVDRVNFDTNLSAGVSGTTLTVTATGGGGSGGWETAFDVNFTQLGTQTIVDGSNSINGVTWTAENISSGADSVVIGSSGLVFTNNATSTGRYFQAASTAPLLKIKLSDLCPGFVLGQSKIRVLMQGTSNGNSNHEVLVFGFHAEPWITNNEVTWHWQVGAYDSISPHNGVMVTQGSSNRSDLDVTSVGSQNLWAVSFGGSLLDQDFYSALTTATDASADDATAMDWAQMQHRAVHRTSEGSNTTISATALDSFATSYRMFDAGDIVLCIASASNNTAHHLISTVKRLKVEWQP